LLYIGVISTCGPNAMSHMSVWEAGHFLPYATEVSLGQTEEKGLRVNGNLKSMGNYFCNILCGGFCSHPSM